MGELVTSGSPKFFLEHGPLIREYVWFISSASDVAEQRNLLDAMIRSTDSQFRLRRNTTRPFTFAVDRWELDAGRKTHEMNDEFVRRAKNAQIVVVLLANQIRPGTQEEIEAVLKQPGVQVSVIWMDKPENSRRHTKLRKFLESKSNELAYVKTGEPGSHESICAMVDVITAALADLNRDPNEENSFNETR